MPQKIKFFWKRKQDETVIELLIVYYELYSGA